MKKLFTLIVAAFMAVSVNAQTETPLVLGGDWNAGFAGDADVYDFTVSQAVGCSRVCLQCQLCRLSKVYPRVRRTASCQLPGELYLEDFC